MGEFLDSFVYEERSLLTWSTTESCAWSASSFVRSPRARALSRSCAFVHAIFFSLDSSRQANVVSHGAERIRFALWSGVRPACGRSSHGFSLLVETRYFPLSGVFLRSNCRKPWSRSLLLLSDQELQQQRVSCAIVFLFARFAFTNYWWLAVASAHEEEEKIVCTVQSERQGGGGTVG